jgi:signal peptidase I
MNRSIVGRPERQPTAEPDQGPGSTSDGSKSKWKPKSKSGRESIESFVVVFVAFLVWSLEAEGFVIPTGSMATTLMGRHKEVVCPECHCTYTVNADREVDSSGTGRSTGARVLRGTCVNCRFETRVDQEPSFSGDRVYVMKLGATLPIPGCATRSALKRWDVTVFKLPEEPEVRYIKRVVGMPNEVVRIEGGDLWMRPVNSLDFPQRLRRTLDHQQAMQMLVYDDEHRAAALQVDARWLRWRPERKGDWVERSPGRFAAGPDSEDWAELRYHHVVPSPEDWSAIRAARPLPGPPRAILITDFNSYNTDVLPDDEKSHRRAARPWFQPHWVGDLTMSLRMKVQKATGGVRIELVESGVRNQCEIDLATGQAMLFHGGSRLGEPAQTDLSHPGAFELTFANVDDRLTLWVDGKLPFGDGLTYESGPGPGAATAADLDPAGVTARRASIEVEGLLLKRDVYYTLEPAECDYVNFDGAAQTDSTAFFELLSDPTRFAELEHHPARDYVLGPARYLMLGDNSPWSRDARAWGQTDKFDPEFPQQGWDTTGRSSWEVPESLLIGKAFCVYWPHPKPVWPRIRLGPDLLLPILPYMERMRFIR